MNPCVLHARSHSTNSRNPITTAAHGRQRSHVLTRESGANAVVLSWNAARAAFSDAGVFASAAA